MIEKLNTLTKGFIMCYRSQLLPPGIPNSMIGIERLVGSNKELVKLQKETRTLVDINMALAKKMTQHKV